MLSGHGGLHLEYSLGSGKAVWIRWHTWTSVLWVGSWSDCGPLIGRYAPGQMGATRNWSQQGLAAYSCWAVSLFCNCHLWSCSPVRNYYSDLHTIDLFLTLISLIHFWKLPKFKQVTLYSILTNPYVLICNTVCKRCFVSFFSRWKWQTSAVYLMTR